MDRHIFDIVAKQGLIPIPLNWDIVSKSAISHCLPHSELTPENYIERLSVLKDSVFNSANGMALKLFAPYGMLDFDNKNTEDKSIFDFYKKAVASQNEDIFRKVCIEETRNGGFHLYFKYSKITSKLTLAREAKGEEVIAQYTGGTLSYCDPTPGYNLLHNTLEDLEELTDDEYDILISCAIAFDKYKGSTDSGPIGEKVLIEYPTEHENTCLQFDLALPEEYFLTIIKDDIGLSENLKYRYTPKCKYKAYVREGTKAAYSAKVYPKSKKVLLFTSSIPGFPHFGSRKNAEDHSWVLTPSRIIYYKNDGDWSAAIDEIKLICDSVGIDIPEPKPELKTLDLDKSKFPIDIFPEEVNRFITSHPFQPDYMAGAFIAAFSTLIGNSCSLTAGATYTNIKAIVYLCIIGAPGSSKTPATKAVFSYIDHIDNLYYKEYEKERATYKEQLAEYKNQKKGDGVKEPEKPVLKQLLVKDVTIEMLFKVLAANPTGCCSFSDELSGYFKRISGRYGDNDELQKMLEMWSGSSVMLQRISRDEDRVQDPFCSIFGGIQPGVANALSSGDNEHNGWYHRFLFVYPEMQDKKDWGDSFVDPSVESSVNALYHAILNNREKECIYTLSPEANRIYGEWYNSKNKKYNNSSEDNIKGIIAKYQDYCLRFALMMQVIHHPERYSLEVTPENMTRAIRLMEYFFYGMHKTLKVLSPASPVEKLSTSNQKFYRALPASFSNKTAIETAKKFNITEANCRVILTRWAKDKENLLTAKGEQQDRIYYKEYL